MSSLADQIARYSTTEQVSVDDVRVSLGELVELCDHYNGDADWLDPKELKETAQTEVLVSLVEHFGERESDAERVRQDIADMTREINFKKRTIEQMQAHISTIQGEIDERTTKLQKLECRTSGR